jgi:UDP-N-acetylmuramoyl-tripeptide--D-alanyl-D-alanine ligase
MLGEEAANLEPTGLSIDSRAVGPGELFIAVPGEKVDGHRFVREAFGRGASAAMVVHHRFLQADAAHGTATDVLPSDLLDRLIFVDNTVCALQQLAARVLAGWGGPVVGITGSAGKTTMKDLTAHLLEQRGRVLRSPGNLNTGYGLALTVARMIRRGAQPADFDLAVIEMGMSSYGEIARLTDLARPSVGVVGNVGTAHIEFFGTSDLVARAKAEMVDGLQVGGTAVLNADDERVRAMAMRRSDISTLTFGIAKRADVMATNLRNAADLRGTWFDLVTPRGTASVQFPLIGAHNVANALAAAAVAHHFGQTAEQIAGGLATAAPTRMRGEICRFANGVTVVDDTYNSNPAALLEAVRALAGSGGDRRLVVVAGEMLELGEQGAELHRQCGRQVAALGIGLLVGVRGLAARLVEGAIEAGLVGSDRAIFFATTEEASATLPALIRPGDLVLIKGSRGVRMERILEDLRAAFGPAGA